MSNCGVCGKFLSPTGGVKCNVCKKSYHKHCISKSSSSSADWKCSSWFQKSQVDANPSSPPYKDAKTSHDPSDNPSPISKISDSAIHKLISEMHRFESSITDLRNELTQFREEIQDMRADMNEIYTEFLACKDDVTKLTEKSIKIEQRLDVLEASEKNTQALQESVNQLAYECNERDQQLLRNDVEMVGVPETNDENLQTILKQAMDTLKMPLEAEDILDIYRAGPPFPHTADVSGSGDRQASLNTGGRAAPRAIVVRCARREYRDRLLAAARARPLCATNLGFQQAPSTRIYFNERLSKHNKKLLYKVLQEKKRSNWRFVWTKEGRILVRREDGEKAIRIVHEQDILSKFV